jgi:hypothetical protein
MDPVDLDWVFTQVFPGDPTITGYVPPVGEHVFCYRPADGKTHCGIVDENRCGLFITCCGGGRACLTAANWVVSAINHGETTP